MKSITLNPTRLVAALAASLSLAAPLFAQTMPGTNPVKIFIVAGESNTSGKGTISPSTTPGTLDHVYANDETGRYQFLKSGGSYAVRNDVWIRSYVTIAGNTPPIPLLGNLTTGYGSNSGLIGPELGFGHIIGDVYENQILIVKVGVDAATLAYSFCPPSSRVGEPEPTTSSQKGFYYKEIIRLVNEAKNNLGTYFPGYNGGGYEIAGLGWHQGWNDRSNPAYAPLYEVNMANFINDIRSADKGIGVANMPVVIASAAMDWNYHYSDVEIAQLKMANASAYPAFAGNVAVVDTRIPYDGLQFWYTTGDSPTREGYHWNRSGKSFLHVGMAMGDAMSQLVATRIPYRIRAYGGIGGVTLTWNNGTETPTSVRVLRNGSQIAIGASVSPPSFLDASAPLGVNNYELQFTMPGSPCPPLTISHNSGITNLKGNQRINGVRLTWDNNRGYSGITVKRNGAIIAASLPGTTTSYTDFSPPTGSVTYSVEPTDAGGTPVSVLVTVSAAPAGGALIYEPFDIPLPPDSTATPLVGNEGGIGLDDKWDGDGNIQVTSDNLYTFGSLPVFGNRIVRTSSNGSCAIPIGNTLQDAGLLEHGAQLWFSFLCQNPNNSNIHPTFALGDDILTYHNTVAQGGNAFGAKLLSGNKVIGMIHKDGVEAAATAAQAMLGASEVVLVVGRITWGANASAPDTIDIYTPDTNLVLDTPLSVSAVVDQSKFKVLSMWGNVAAPNMDEIRFGDSYLDVIGQGTDTSGDLTAPTPTTMSFASPPAATSTSAITMTATTASDTNGVQYYFDETSGNPGGTDSGWQDSPVYSDTGLNPNTQYTYTVQARDKSVNNNPNTASSPASATTFAPDTTPPSPATMSFATPPAATSTSAITMTATTASDTSGVQYFFDETSGNPGGTDSGWQDSPVYSDTGLNPNTQYIYTVQARDKSVNNNTNTASSPASTTTFTPDTNPPPTPGFATPPNATSFSAITMTAGTVTDPEGGAVEYLFTETSGNPGGSSSSWQSSPTYTDSGLNPNTQYTYTVKARDNALPPNESAGSAPASATTPVLPASTAQAAVTTRTSFATAGTDQTWVCPAGVTSVQIEAWGGGGAGGGATATAAVKVCGGGGGAGAYVRKKVFSVTPGTTYYINIPAAAAPSNTPVTDGTTANAGGSVTFCTGTGGSGPVVTAPGGAGGVNKNLGVAGGGAGGLGATAGGYDVQLAGGNGGSGSTIVSGGGGGGPSDLFSGGSTANNAAGAGAAGVYQSGGNGGAGRNSAGTSNNGGNPGAGGGGGFVATVTSAAGGSGGLGMLALTYDVPTIVKANNIDNLNLTTSWTGGSVPDSTQAVLWDSTVTAANAVVLGADANWKGIGLTSPGGNVTINAGNTLTLNSAGLGIDMTTATKELTLNCPLTAGARQSWNVALGRTLTLGGGVTASSGLVFQGSGTFKFSNPGSGSTNTISGLNVPTADATILSDYNGGSGNLSTTLGTVSRPFGSTLNISVVGSPGTNNFVNLTGSAGFVNAGVFYNGTDFAWRDALNGYVRAPNYGEAGTSAANAVTGGTHALVNANTSIASAANITVSSFKITGNTAFAITGGGRLIPPAIVASGGTSSINASAVQNAASFEAIYRVDGSSDQLTILCPTVDNPAGASLIKSGAGKLIFAGNMVHAGNTYVNGGTVEFQAGYTPATKNLFLASGATFIYNNASTTLNLSGGIIGGGNLTKNGASTMVLSAANTFSGTTKVLGGFLTLSHALALQNSTLDTDSSAANTLKATVGTLTIGGLTGSRNFDVAAGSMFATSSSGYTSTPGATALILNPGAGASPSYSGIIANGTAGMSLTKTGAGTQTLGGANSYTGATTISAGTLKLGANDVLPNGSAISLGAATLDADSRTDTCGTLDVTGAATINLGSGAALAFAASDSINSGTWSGTLTITGSLGANSIRFGTSGSALTAAQLSKITVNGSGAWALDSNGYLVTASVASAYDTWKAANAPGSAPDDDTDGDGVSNALEFVLGGTSATKDLNKLPTVSTSGTDMLFTFYRKQSSIDPKTSLAIEVGTDLATWNTSPSPYSVPNGAVGPVNPGINVVKGIPVGFDTITLTLPLVPDTKKFARLRVLILP